MINLSTTSKHPLANNEESEELFEKCTRIEPKLIDTQPLVYTPGVRPLGISAQEGFKLNTLVEQLFDYNNATSGTIFHPVHWRVQRYKKISLLLTEVEYIPTLLATGEYCLTVHSPSPEYLSKDSWPESTLEAVGESRGVWGDFVPNLSDHSLHFKPSAHPPEVSLDFPEPLKLFEDLLLAHVIDSVDHPLIQAHMGNLRSGYCWSECEELVNEH